MWSNRRVPARNHVYANPISHRLPRRDYYTRWPALIRREAIDSARHFLPRVTPRTLDNIDRALFPLRKWRRHRGITPRHRRRRVEFASDSDANGASTSGSAIDDFYLDRVRRISRESGRKWGGNRVRRFTVPDLVFGCVGSSRPSVRDVHCWSRCILNAKLLRWNVHRRSCAVRDRVFVFFRDMPGIFIAVLKSLVFFFFLPGKPSVESYAMFRSDWKSRRCSELI